MSRVQVYLLGMFRVRQNGNTLAGFEAQRLQELFGYLLLHRERPHNREQLAALLWGDVDTAQSKRYLSKTLWKLLSAFEAIGLDLKEQDLLVDADWLQLRPGNLWVDVAVVEESVASVRGIPGYALSAAHVARIKRAVRLYQAELLLGWYQEWCLFERERLHQLYHTALDKLMQYCEARQEYERGVAYGMQILRSDRARERTHRGLMRLYYLAGDRTGALRQFRQCQAALAEELAVDPSAPTRELHRQIKRGDPIQPPFAHLPLSDGDKTLVPLLERWRKLQAVSAEMQARITHEIKVLEALSRKPPSSGPRG